METLRDAGAETEAGTTPGEEKGTGERDPLAGKGSGGGAMLPGAADGIGIAVNVRADVPTGLSETVAGLGGSPWVWSAGDAESPCCVKDGAAACVPVCSMSEECTV